ncbi:MAG: hypothetical protein LBE74_09395 [Treponema sp.]|jgi:hypothetical protein|nr:hypothetical protein [Treponema sp.]
MADFGSVAVMAAKLCMDNTSVNPREAWDKSCEKLGLSDYQRKKGCPKSAFLGLCEEGFVYNVPKGNYTRSVKNKSYGIATVKILAKNPSLVNNVDNLWAAIREEVPDRCKTHNGQMDVVIALWVNNMIKRQYQNKQGNEK